MRTLFAKLFPEDYFATAYRTYDQYLEDLRKQAELLLIPYCQLTQNNDYPLDKFRGVVIDAKQVQTIFLQNQKLEQLAPTLRGYLDKVDFFIESRREATGEGVIFAIQYFADLHRLSALERFGLLLHLLPYLDKRYEKLFGYLRDDITLKYPDTELILKLYYATESTANIPDYYRQYQALQAHFERILLLDETIDSRTLGFLLSNAEESPNMNGLELYIPLQNTPLEMREDLAQELTQLLTEPKAPLHLVGEEGMGKRTLLRRCADIMDIPLVLVDGKQEDFAVYLIAYREAAIHGAMLCVYHAEHCPHLDSLLEKRLTDAVIVLSEAPRLPLQTLCIEVEVPPLSKQESMQLWETVLGTLQLAETLDNVALANQFDLTFSQIEHSILAARHLQTRQQAGLTKAQVHRCVYQQIQHKLGDLCTLIPAKHDWSQLILADEQKEMLKHACDQIRYKHRVYDDWGFHRRIAYGRGVSMLFEGPPGTGKTMAAQVVGHELAIDIYKVDLSQIVSKYIGETEKNLNNLFTQAKKSNVILFFDETDAILGKRTEVKDSHDRNANLETSYLLQKMEEYDGITVMTTNYLENIDPAFFRRISYIIHFPFPDTPSRKAIWQGIFPPEVPLNPDIDFDYLAKQFELSGGNIKNIALTSAFLAAKSETQVLAMPHIIKAIRYELNKQKKVILKEDFGEYAFFF